MARSASAPWPISRRFGRADAAGLADGVRREVVVVHVALAGHRGEGVQLLLHAEHVEGGDAQDLGLATLEQRRAVHARDGLDLGGERTDVRDAAAVDADLVLDDALADQGLGQRAVRGGDLLLAALELREQLLGGELLDAVQLGLALLLAGDGERLGELGA